MHTLDKLLPVHRATAGVVQGKRQHPGKPLSVPVEGVSTYF